MFEFWSPDFKLRIPLPNYAHALLNIMEMIVDSRVREILNIFEA